MMQLTEEQRKALIEHAKAWIADADAARDEIPFGFDEDTEKEFSLIKIALASLTAEPVAVRYRWSPPHMKMPDGSQFYGDWKLVHDPAIANPSADYERVNLYTATPAPAIKPVKLPDDGLDDCIRDWGPEQARNNFDTGYNYASWRYQQELEKAGYQVEGE